MDTSLSMIDAAFEIVKSAKHAVSFETLLKKVQERKHMTDEEIKQRRSQFYTNLSLDSRFVNLGSKGWDLALKHSFAVVHEEVKDLDAESEINVRDLVEEQENEEQEREEGSVSEDFSEEIFSSSTNAEEE